MFELDVATELAPRFDFLEELGVPRGDVPALVSSFPLVLGLDVDTRMRPAMRFLRELGVDEGELARIGRAFPSILGLDPTEHFKPALAFLNEIGVQNLPRSLHRCPLRPPRPVSLATAL